LGNSIQRLDKQHWGQLLVYQILLVHTANDKLLGLKT